MVNLVFFLKASFGDVTTTKMSKTNVYYYFCQRSDETLIHPALAFYKAK